MDSLRGQLLIAPPHLTDPNFAKTVVLMVQHDREGAFGIVLNRPTDTRLDEVWARTRQRRCARTDFLHLGGPVEGPLVMLHEDPSCGDVEILDGVFCCTRASELEQHVETEQAPARFFAGYAGWGGGQLETELSVGSWLTAPAEKEHVFVPLGSDLWARLFREYVDQTSLPPGFQPRDDDTSRN